MDALYQTNQYCSPIEINLHSVDCKQSKNWVTGSWGTTIPLIFWPLVIPSKGSYCECQQIQMTYVVSSHNPQVNRKKMAECLVPVSNTYSVNNAKPWFETGSRVKGITNPYQLFAEGTWQTIKDEMSQL